MGIYQVTQKRGRRHSAAAAYLQPIRGRPNLTIRTRAHATRIMFDGNRASGLRYLAGGREQQAVAAREVILCGGAVNSPQLLLLSGVGPADHLRGLGIRVVADLPGVGENLQDHLAMGVIYRCKEPITLASAETLGNLLRYIVLRRGPLTSNVAEAGGFMRLHRRLGLARRSVPLRPDFLHEPRIHHLPGARLLRRSRVAAPAEPGKHHAAPRLTRLSRRPSNRTTWPPKRTWSLSSKE